MELTTKEKEVLELNLAGYSLKEIAYETNRSPLTVKTHFQNVREKYGVNTIMEAGVKHLKKVYGIDIKKLLQVTLALSIIIMAEVMNSYDLIRTRNVKAKTAKVMKRPRARKTKEYELEAA